MVVLNTDGACWSLDQVLGGSVDGEVCNKDLAGIGLKLTKDTIPNVRFNAVKALIAIMPKLDASYDSL